MRCYEVYDHLVAHRPRLLDAGWLTEFLRPHCRLKVLGCRGSRLRIVQCPSEFARFLAFMGEQQISSYLEIGTSTGGSWFLVDSYLRAVNPNYQRSVGYDRTSKLRDWEGYRQRFQAVEFRRQHSKEIDLKEESFDLAFVDAKHEERWVRHDFEKVKAHCRLVAFHDIVLPGATVDKAWQQIRDEGMRYWEFIDESLPRTCGIGVVVLK
jgi:predicted O-methyltransferase YrrM